ncbi:MAG: polyprenyl synthetase family protein [Pseudomonadota bacterium]
MTAPSLDANGGGLSAMPQGAAPEAGTFERVTESEAYAVTALGFEREMSTLHNRLQDWLYGCDAELKEAVDWQFLGGSKYFRPLTVFSCFKARFPHAPEVPDQILRAAQGVEIFHNVSLVIDDILDKSDERRGRDTLQRRFGELQSLMASGYMMAEGYRAVIGDPHSLELLCELMTRLASAECLQWRLRQMPLGVEDWRRIAGEDTGSMFEVCACLGDRSGDLRRYGHLLGLLYHGCDDVGDIRGAKALGGGGQEDLRDGILTLPASFAIRDPDVARMFAAPNSTNIPMMADAFAAVLPMAEAYLDQIADEAISEARTFSEFPEPLERLVSQTRQLSNK